MKKKFFNAKIYRNDAATEMSNQFKLKQQTWQANYDYLVAVLDQNTYE